MHVVTLVEALTGPDSGARQRVDQVFAFDVRLAEGGGCRLPVILLRHRIGDVGVEIKAFVALFPHFLAQLQFGIGFAFVAQTVFALRAGSLKALLFAAAAGPADAGTGVAGKVDRHRRGRDRARRDGDSDGKFAQSYHFLSPEIIAFIVLQG